MWYLLAMHLGIVTWAAIDFVNIRLGKRSSRIAATRRHEIDEERRPFMLAAMREVDRFLPLSKPCLVASCKPWCGLPYRDNRVPGQRDPILSAGEICWCSVECRQINAPV